MAHLPWAELLADRVYCDMHLVSEDDEKIPAHQIVLATQSNAIEEALNNPRKSGEGGFLFSVGFQASIVRQVVKALYTGKFEPLDQPCVNSEQTDDGRPVDENESERQKKNRSPHQMMFCAKSIRLLLDLQLKTGDLVQQTWDTLERISKQHLSHVDFPGVVEYTLDCIYEPSSSEAPWFYVLYANHQRVRESLRPILLDHPEVLEVLSNLLARGIVLAAAKLQDFRRQVEELESNGSAEATSNTSSSSLDINPVLRGFGKRSRFR